jgi:hypothetical protein
VKVAVQAPVVPAIVGEPTGVPSKVTAMLLSPEENPDPVTPTEVPAGPLVLFKEIPAPTVKATTVTGEVEEPEAPTLWAPP